MEKLNKQERDTSVPMIYIDQSIKIFITNYQKGADADQPDTPPMAEEAQPGNPV